MTPYIADVDFTLYVGDATEVLRALPVESVHCVVTSPPYWGLRDYGTGSWVGGNPDCDHLAPLGGGFKSSTLTHGPGQPLKEYEVEQVVRNRQKQYGNVCGKCGATRTDQQLGLEPTPEAYVESMVAVFREVRRVMRMDAPLWLNLGDAFADKQLQGLPWRVAFALQADGWYLRSDIIWSKPNPMPESVTDRPTKAHEYLFLLTRSPRYFYDADAIREPATENSGGAAFYARKGLPMPPRPRPNGDRNDGGQPSQDRVPDYAVGRNKRSVWEIATEPYPDAHFATFPQALVEPCVKAGSPLGGIVLDPFMGSGTTALVARKHGRRSIGIELNPEYARLAARRLSQLSLLAEPA